jgi:PAS domain S-box-containing protein
MSRIEDPSSTDASRELEALRRENERLRRQCEQRADLAPIESMLSALVRYAPMGWGCIDRQYRYVRVNESLAAFNGRAVQEHIGRTIDEIVPQAAPVLRGFADQVFASGQPVSNQELIDTSPWRDRPLHVLCSFYPIHGADGQVSMVGATVMDITDYRLQQDALRRSEAEFRAIFENSGVPKAVGEVGTGRYIRVNPRYCQLTGYSAEELSRMTFAELTHPDDREADLARYSQILDGTRDYYENEKRYVRKDGQIVWVFVNTRMVRDAFGRPQCTVAVAQDVTARREAEQRARESADRLTLTLVASGMGDWVWDARTDMVRMSARANALFGLGPEETITWAQMRQLLHPDDREQARLAVERAAAERIDYNIEYRVLLPHGRLRWIAARGRGQYDSSGRCTGMIGVVQDVTDRKLRERALQESAERLVLAQRSAGAGAWDWDIRHGTFAWSEQYFSLLGIDPQDARPSYEMFLASIDPADRERIEHEVAQTLRLSRTDVRLEFRVNHPQLGSRWIEALGRCILEDGKVVRMSGIGLNITERKEAEQQLRLAKEEAETARRQAEAASRAKDHFLAQLSHELRTPLTPVLMAAQAMENDASLPPDLRADVVMIKRNVELEARLIDDLLDLTRIARGKVELHREVSDLHGLLQHALNTCIDEPARQKQLHFRTELHAAEPHAWADPARIQQVFWNIIKNAIKFTGPGGFVTVRTSNPTPQVIRVEVADSGVGIPPDALPAIFNAFEQGGANVTRRFGGLGLGLAICKALVDMHGGQISAHSEGPGTGAMFRMDLPALPEALPDAAGQQPGAAEAAETRRQLRVLLVEDHESTARVLQRLLSGERYAIQTAPNVRTALALAERERFDLLVSDLGLPDGSGFQLMADLKKRHPGLRGIAVSGYGMEEDRRRSAAAGFDRHLVKPINFQTLREALDEVTRESKVLEAERAQNSELKAQR